MSADQIKDSGLRADSRLRNLNMSPYGGIQRGEHKISIPNPGDNANLLLSEGDFTLNGAATLTGATTISGATTLSGATTAISGVATLSGATTISGATTLSGATTTISGTASLTGATTLANATIDVGGYLNVDSGTGTAATSAVTISKMAGVITSEALTTAAAGTEAITVTNTTVAATDLIVATCIGGTNTQLAYSLQAIPGAGSFTLNIHNSHASAAFDGTFIVSFLVLKA